MSRWWGVSTSSDTKVDNIRASVVATSLLGLLGEHRINTLVYRRTTNPRTLKAASLSLAMVARSRYVGIWE